MLHPLPQLAVESVRRQRILTGPCFLVPRAFENRRTRRSWLHNDLHSYRWKLATATLRVYSAFAAYRTFYHTIDNDLRPYND
jgi:hypothetical protein